eukprot:SAG22_NODE_1885_length_3376_cov_1.712542_4_plen_61_part_00
MTLAARRAAAESTAAAPAATSAGPPVRWQDAAAGWADELLLEECSWRETETQLKVGVLLI